MSFLASAVPALVTSGASFLGSKLFGSSGSQNPQAALTSFAPTGISAGGLNTSFSGGNIGVSASPERLGLVRNISDTFTGLAGELGGLRSKVAPGISELRTSRLGEIEGARASAIGNLRENLQRRRVLGSSFGQDALTRAESEFAGQRERVAAESTLAELEMTNNLINQQFAALRGSFQTGLDELNLEAQVAAGLSGKATDALSANARMLAALNAQEAAGAGKFFGQTFQPAFKAFGDLAGSFFKQAA